MRVWLIGWLVEGADVVAELREVDVGAPHPWSIAGGYPGFGLAGAGA